MKKALIVLGVLLIAYFLIQYSRSDYLAFNEQREDWHRRCDAYVGSTATLTDPAKTAACKRELSELLAYAKQKGWAK